MSVFERYSIKRGDIIQISSKEVCAENAELSPKFIKEMYAYCNKISTIEHVRAKQKYGTNFNIIEDKEQWVYNTIWCEPYIIRDHQLLA